MGTKHTPGPWQVGAGGNAHANRVWTADMRPIVNLCSMSTGIAMYDPEAQANARLIAAAPELLEVVRELIEAGHEDAALMRRAELSIAKATGDE